MGNSNFPSPPARTISWMQEVLYADPNWNQGYTRPIIYEFSNGRTFTAPIPLYGTSTNTGTGTGTGTSTSTGTGTTTITNYIASAAGPGNFIVSASGTGYIATATST